MKTIEYSAIVDSVKKLCITANIELPPDVRIALDNALMREESERAVHFLHQCVDNAVIAHEQQLPICQDTGIAVFFILLGTEVTVQGGSLYDAIQEGTARGYCDGFLRKSIVNDPVYDRKNTGNNTPAVIHIELTPGDKLTITCAPKGAGSENMSAVAFLKPSQGEKGIIDFVTKTVIDAGGNPCPPVIVGVGIGGTFERCTFLAKKALLRETGNRNHDARYAQLEQIILDRINASGVGAQGLGGTVTACAVHIEYAPCHIASLPVAVNINCHVARHQTIVL